jgi:flagellar assembly protein FliH
MLSKVVDASRIQKKLLQTYNLPTPDELVHVMDEKKRQSDRRRVVDSNREDPLTAAKLEAHRILAEAQDRSKAAEVDVSLLRGKMEADLRTKLDVEIRSRVDAEVGQLSARYEESLEEIATLRDTVYRDTEDELLKMVYTVVRKIIGDEVKTSPNIILNMLRKGFERIKEASQYEIKINPNDYEILLAHKDKIKGILKTSGAVKFVKDESIERGGCKSVTETGEISSEPGRQLDVIIKELQHGT